MARAIAREIGVSHNTVMLEAGLMESTELRGKLYQSMWDTSNLHPTYCLPIPNLFRHFKTSFFCC
jgi:hypothetical protein